MLLSSYSVLEVDGSEGIILIFDGKQGVKCVVIGTVILGLETFKIVSGIRLEGIFRSPETVY